MKLLGNQISRYMKSESLVCLSSINPITHSLKWLWTAISLVMLFGKGISNHCWRMLTKYFRCYLSAKPIQILIWFCMYHRPKILEMEGSIEIYGAKMVHCKDGEIVYSSKTKYIHKCSIKMKTQVSFNVSQYLSITPSNSLTVVYVYILA